MAAVRKQSKQDTQRSVCGEDSEQKHISQIGFPFGRERGSLFGREFLCKSNNSMQGKFPKFRHPRPCARIFSVFSPFCAGFRSPLLLVPRDAINMELFQITINHITCDTETSRERFLSQTKKKGKDAAKCIQRVTPPHPLDQAIRLA
jgi:hypothetical protein